MKHGTGTNPKFISLQRKLGLSWYQTVGLLEGLWYRTYEVAREGNIGRLSNEEIAAMLEWDGDADDLVAALINTGWLDTSIEHRLIIHDWHDHCPIQLRAAFAKHGREFVTGAASSPKKKTKKKRNVKKAQDKPAKPRERNPIWDAVVGVFYPSGVPKSQATRVGRVVADLKELGATEDEIKRRCAHIPDEWKPVSAEVIVKHWDNLNERPKHSGHDSRVQAEPGKYDNVGIQAGSP